MFTGYHVYNNYRYWVYSVYTLVYEYKTKINILYPRCKFNIYIIITTVNSGDFFKRQFYVEHQNFLQTINQNVSCLYFLQPLLIGPPSDKLKCLPFTTRLLKFAIFWDRHVTILEDSIKLHNMAFKFLFYYY